MRIRNCIAAICLFGCTSVASAHGHYGFYYDDGDTSISVGSSQASQPPAYPAHHFEPGFEDHEHHFAPQPPRRFGHDFRPRFTERY